MTANTYGPVWLARTDIAWTGSWNAGSLHLVACTSLRAWHCRSRQPNNNGMHGHSLARGGLGWLDAMQATIKETKQAYES